MEDVYDDLEEAEAEKRDSEDDDDISADRMIMVMHICKFPFILKHS